MEYWKYYDDQFGWDNNNPLYEPNLDHTIELLKNNGVSEKNARSLFNSGFVCFPGFKVLIDRFYGGALSSIDMNTRFPLDHANKLITMPPRSLTPLQKVKSVEELKAVLESMT